MSCPRVEALDVKPRKEKGLFEVIRRWGRLGSRLFKALVTALGKALECHQ